MDNQKRGAAGLEGGEYQIKLILVSSLRATKVYGGNFQLRTELKDDGKFDDLVLLYRTTIPAQSKEYRRCLQAKHKMNENNNIALDDLLIDSKKGFNLYAYFETYIDMANHSNDTTLKDMILFTNLKFNQNVTEFVDHISTLDDIFHFGDVKKDRTVPALYQFNEKFREMFKYSKLIKLAEQIILYSHIKKIEMKHNNNTFKDYHNVLAKYVIDVKNKCFHSSFITGDGISDPTTLVLREIILNKCGLNAAEVDVKLSKGFGSDPSYVWPKGTTLNEEELEKVESFFNHLIFGVNQPNEEELNTYIHNEIKTLYEASEAETELRASHFIDSVRNWFKEKEISYLSKIEMDQFNESVNRKIESIALLNIGEMFCEKLRAPQINFQTINTQQKFDAFLCDKDKSIFHIEAIKKYTRLSSIKTLHALQNTKPKCKFLFIPLKKDMIRKIMKLISLFQQSKDCTVLAMEVLDVQLQDTIYFQLDKIIEEQKHKKIIIISDEFSLPVEYQATCERCCDETPFDHLSLETRGNLFEKKISFQGFIVSLKDIVLENDVSKLEYTNWWLPLMFNNDINIGPELKLSNAYNLKYFIPRNTYQRTVIPDKEIENIQSQDIVVFTSEEYLKQVEENPKRNVHHLIKCPKYGVWIWQNTSGEISNIRKRMTNTFTAIIIKDTKLQIIADNAGMGKSTLISHDAWEMKKTDPSLWIIRFNLIAFSSELKQFGENKDASANKFISEQLLKFPQHSVEETMFYSRMSSESNSNIVFMFDGFDEVNEVCQEYVTSIIKSLLNTSSIKRIIISTRRHLQEKLEDNFSQFAIHLRPFTDEDKIQFLMKYWSESAKTNSICLEGAQDENEIQKMIKIFAEKVLNSFSKEISDNFSLFTGIPLQMRMIAEILENDAMDYIKGESTSVGDWSSVSVSSIYEQFIDKKKEIFMKEKSQFSNCNRIVENALKQTVARINHLHAELAMNLMFKSESFVNEADDEMINSMIQFGLVLEWNGKLYFIQVTFAEYYIALFFTGKISLPSLDFKQYLERFEESSLLNVRLFVDDLITIDVTAYDHLKTHFLSIIRLDTRLDKFIKNLFQTYSRTNLNLKVLDLILDCIHDIDEESGSSDVITSLFAATNGWFFTHDNPKLLTNIIENIKNRYDPKCVRFRDLVSIIVQRIPMICRKSNEENYDEYRDVVKYLIDFLIFVEEQKYLESDIIVEELKKFSFERYDGCELFFLFLDFLYEKSPVVLEDMLAVHVYFICDPKTSKYFTWLETKTNFSSASILNFIGSARLHFMYVNNIFCILNNFITTVLNHSKAKYGVAKLKSISDPSFTDSFKMSFKRLFNASPCNEIDKILCGFVIDQFGVESLNYFLEVQNKENSRIESCCLWSRIERLRYLLEDTDEESVRKKIVEILKALKQKLSSEDFHQIISERNEYKESILQRACRENDINQMDSISSWIDSDEIFESLTSIKDKSAFWFCVTLLNLIKDKFPNRIEHFLLSNGHVFFQGDYFELISNAWNFKDYFRELYKTILNALEQLMSKESLFRILSHNYSTFADLCFKMNKENCYLEGVERLLNLIEKNEFGNDEIFRLMSQRWTPVPYYRPQMHFIELIKDIASRSGIVRDFLKRNLRAEQITEINRLIDTSARETATDAVMSRIFREFTARNLSVGQTTDLERLNAGTDAGTSRTDRLNETPASETETDAFTDIQMQIDALKSILNNNFNLQL